jgi:catechol 2,3-dioxygenase-like lactoylglutathione lyase family enzyme
MKTTLLTVVVLTAVLAHSTDRPKITGIDHVAFYTTSPEANKRLYMDLLGIGSSDPAESGQTQRFMFGFQWVGYSPAPDPKATERMDHVAFETSNCTALRNYLAANHVKLLRDLADSKQGIRTFMVADPEGHRIEFVENTNPGRGYTHIGGEDNPISRHLIHVGFVVHDRAAEDHFYKDILGFHLYWYGGMQDDRTDWVSMQVPDGTDWVEYMLNIKPNADLRAIGVMNHISLGVKDIKQAVAKVDVAIAQLPADSRPRRDEQPKVGRGGKWQFNIYDPDQTRIELMEFTPAQKPCCSEYQGPHPTE